MLRILTDSTADLPAALAQRMQVEIVPLQVTFENGDTYRDGLDLPPEEFYQRLSECHKLPSTSQPSPEAFEPSCFPARSPAPTSPRRSPLPWWITTRSI